MALDIRPLGEALGAEVVGFDLVRDLNDTMLKEVNRAWADNVVLCFRDQQLTPDLFVQLARMFGEPVKQLVKHEEFGLPGYPEIGIVSSEHRDTLGDGKRIMRGGSWHTDHSHILEPPRGTMLYAIQIPERGGNTSFTNQCLAYEALPEDTKRRIDGLRVKHVYVSKYSPRRMPTRSQEEEEISPGAVHPLVRTHPATGRKALYLNPIRTETIEGMNDSEAQTLLDALLRHSIQPQFRYSHVWRRNDVLIWDNRQALHMVEHDYDFSKERRMHRIMIAGEKPV